MAFELKLSFGGKSEQPKAVEKSTQKDMSDIDKIIQQITYEALYAEKQKLSDWVDARNLALDYQQPNWVDLIRVYDDLIRDPHVKSIIGTIKNKIKSKPFEINNNGVLNEELTKIFHNEFHHKLIDFIIDGQFFPYSIIQLGNFNSVSGFYELDMVQREYIITQYKQIKKSLTASASKTGSSSLIGGGLYNSDELKPYFVEVLSSEKLGMMDNVIPWILAKKSALQSWMRYSEMFGLPFRVGKTDIRDNSRRSGMVNMMKAWGESGWGVFDNADSVELIANSGSGSCDIYENLMKFANNEISKIFAGAVGVLDEKSFVGSAEAGERMMQEYVNMFMVKVQYIYNADILPRIYNTYKFGNDGNNFSFTTIDTTKLKGQENLKGTVGGVQGLIQVITGVSQGLINKEGAAPILNELYGFDMATIETVLNNINKGVVINTGQTPVEKPTAMLKTNHGKRLVGFSNFDQIENYYKEIIK